MWAMYEAAGDDLRAHRDAEAAFEVLRDHLGRDRFGDFSITDWCASLKHDAETAAKALESAAVTASKTRPTTPLRGETK